MARSRRRYARNARLRLVHDNAGDRHGRVSAKHASFLFVDEKPFVLGDVPDSGQEVSNSLFRLGVSDRREGQVISVSRVLPAELCRNAGQPRVEPAGDEIGKGRAGASALRQRPLAGGDVKNLAGILDSSPRRFGAKQGENRGRRGRITQVLECAPNAVERNRRKKVLQIDVDEHLTTRMFDCVGANRAARDETVRGRMRRRGAEERSGRSIAGRPPGRGAAPTARAGRRTFLER